MTDTTKTLEATLPSGNARCQKVNKAGSQCRFCAIHPGSHGFEKIFNKSLGSKA